jgi:hypothetical protein
MRLAVVALCGLFSAAGFAQPKAEPEYVKKGTRPDTVRATLAANGLPALDGKWYYAGPFDNADRQGFATAYPPEKGVDLTATYTGKDGVQVAWKELRRFTPGQVHDLIRLFPGVRTDAVVYLYHEFTSEKAFTWPLSLGADDSLSVWFNGKRVVHEDHERAAAPDQFKPDLKVVAGTNKLLLKVVQYGGEWKVYAAPEVPDALPATLAKRIDRDFPPAAQVQSAAAASASEAAFYKVTTLPPPDDCVLEVGGLAFRPDGKLLACTRRGEIWLVHNPGAPNPADVKFTRFASGLHEALGVHVVDDKSVYVVQRPELTLLTDRDGDGTADQFRTVCDKWGVSGDYHEFAFGPAVDKAGKFFVTLNVGFGGGHQAKAAWRGWCLKIDPKTGSMEPWAYGLRSPNGVEFSPEGELFYADNQGEWVATNKLQHLKKGKFYGHQAGLKWVKDSPFAGRVSDTVKSGMWYDGTNPRDPDGPKVFPDVDPPAIWFPYGRMGQSASEPKWDTTDGKFGPFAGQCFVGDQTRSMVMRVALEKVNGVYQGACFPFRSGLQCGVNRIAFGPDGAMYVGQTNRGWGSVGGKPYGLQRIAFTGQVPFEVHSIKLTADGFDLTFTKPLDPATAKAADAAAVKSWTYVYFKDYGCPETDPTAEAVDGVTVSADRRTVSVAVPGLRKGRVYELRLPGVRSAGGEAVLHPEAYYTLNEVVRRPAKKE